MLRRICSEIKASTKPDLIVLFQSLRVRIATPERDVTSCLYLYVSNSIEDKQIYRETRPFVCLLCSCLRWSLTLKPNERNIIAEMFVVVQPSFRPFSCMIKGNRGPNNSRIRS